MLATEADQYAAGLTSYRYLGRPSSADAVSGVNRWLATFASATRRAAVEVAVFETRIADIQADWRTALNRVRAKSATELLIGALPGTPVVTVASAAALIGRTTQATNEAFKALASAGVITQVNVGRHRTRPDRHEAASAAPNVADRAHPTAEHREPARRVDPGRHTSTIRDPVVWQVSP